MKIYRILLATICAIGFIFFVGQILIFSKLIGWSMYTQVVLEHAAVYFSIIYFAAFIGLCTKRFFGVIAYCILVLAHLIVNAFFFEKIHFADLFAMFHSTALLIYAVLLLKHRKASGFTRI